MSEYRRSYPKSISSIVSQRFASVPMYSINKKWKDIVGDLLFKVTSPLKIKDGTLIVGVQQHAWLQELTLIKNVMLEKIRPYWKDIQDVKFILLKRK